MIAFLIPTDRRRRWTARSKESSAGGGPLKKRRTDSRSSAGGDRLSKLEDSALGHILSFLPAKEAARAALLSSRWRHVFAAVHTVILEEPPEVAIDNVNWVVLPPGFEEPSPFSSAVSLALLALVAMGGYRGGDSPAVDQWVSHAVQHAAPEGLDLGLRFYCRRNLCDRRYSLRRRAAKPDTAQEPEPIPETPTPTGLGYQQWMSYGDVSDEVESSPRTPVPDIGDDDDDDSSVVVPSSDDEDDGPPPLPSSPGPPEIPEYTVTGFLYSMASCGKLRSLSLGSCRLPPPPASRVLLFPSLETLLLSHISDDAGRAVARLIDGCPLLADLTLEACDAVTELSIHAQLRLRRLVVRCCHSLAAVTVGAYGQLEAFEYRGHVPEVSFLAMRGGSGAVGYCKIDVCGGEVSSEEELAKLTRLLRVFENAKHLHLESARISFGMQHYKDGGVVVEFPAFTSLRRLELRGRMPNDDVASVRVVGRILERTPNLEALSLFFHPEEEDDNRGGTCHGASGEEEELAHNLSYDRHAILEEPSALVVPCLRSKVREINLVHYQGGRAQRTLAKFLLRNAPAIAELRCEFTEGPLWTQTQLMREIRGWVMNESANTRFA